jgi:hypothetical protein
VLRVDSPFISPSNRHTQRRFWLQHIVSEVNGWGGAYGVGVAIVTVSSTPVFVVVLRVQTFMLRRRSGGEGTWKNIDF